MDLDVYARATDAFRIQLPAAVDLAEVEAPELDRWTIRDRGNGTATVALKFRKPFLGRRAVRLLALAPIPAAVEWDVPTLKVLDSASHVGQVSACCSPSLQIEVGNLAGIRPERGEQQAAMVSPPPTRKPAPSLDGDLSGDLSGGCRPDRYRLPSGTTISSCLCASRRGALAVQASIATLLEDRADRRNLAHQCHAPTAACPVVRRPSAVAARVGSHFRAGSRQGGGLGIGVGGWHWRCQWHARTGSAVVGRIANPSHASGSASGTLAALQAVRFELAEPLNPGQSLEIALVAQRRTDRWLEQDEGYHELPLPDLRLAGAGRGRGDAAGPGAAGDRVGRVEHLGRFAAGGRRRAGGRFRSGCGHRPAVPLPGRRPHRRADSGPADAGQGVGGNAGLRPARPRQNGRTLSTRSARPAGKPAGGPIYAARGGRRENPNCSPDLDGAGHRAAVQAAAGGRRRQGRLVVVANCPGPAGCGRPDAGLGFRPDDRWHRLSQWHARRTGRLRGRPCRRGSRSSPCGTSRGKAAWWRSKRPATSRSIASRRTSANGTRPTCPGPKPTPPAAGSLPPINISDCRTG